MKLFQRITYSTSVISLCSSFCYALPFNIFPQSPLPTQVAIGQSVNALYTVQNNTRGVRLNNFVKYLPLNVTQVTTNPAIPNLCGLTFNLAPKGTPGDSCTLSLNITGAVLANDPDPHHHLFVCLPGGATCAGTLFPLNVSIAANIREVTVGFGQSGIINIPLAYFSDDTGITWTRSNLPLQPSALTGVACVGSNCAAVGPSTSSSDPVGYTSSDGGVNWTISTGLTAPPPLGTVGFLTGVSCVDNSCSAVGQSIFANFLPLAYVSANNGASWTLVPAFTLPGGATDGSLTSVSCTGTNCVAAGSTSGGPTSLVVYTSTNLGSSWSAPITGFTFPGGTTTGVLNGVSCKNNLCVAVGNVTGANTFPVAYTSNDSGNTWTLSSSFAATSTIGSLAAVSCFNSHCIAVGFEGDGVTAANPLAYLSDDNGLTWNVTTFTLTTGPVRLLTGVKCYNANNCTAVGAYGIVNNFLPLIYTTTNGGSSWSLVTNPFEPIGFSNALTSVS